MIKMNEISPTAFVFFGLAALLIATAAIFVCVNVFLSKLYRRYKVVGIVLSVVSLFLTLGAADIRKAEKGFSPFAKIVGEMPVYCFLASLELLAVAVTAFCILLIKKKRTTLTPNAVRESLDALPDGVCFSSSDGMPLLVNKQADMLCGEIFGKGIMNANTFFEDLKRGCFKNGAELIRSTPSITVKTADGKVFDFRRRDIKVGKLTATELIACDITEQHRLLSELRSKNKKMDEICAHLAKFNEDITILTHKKEILRATEQVHDDLGLALLMLRKYIATPKAARNREELLFRWKYNIAVLNSEITPTDTDKRFEDIACDMGVEVVINGSFPEEKHITNTICDAIKTFIPNVVRHAGGKTLFVNISENENSIKAIFTNDGSPPTEKIREGGGLQRLRARTEEIGGTMTVESTPQFKTVLSFPTQRKEV